MCNFLFYFNLIMDKLYERELAMYGYKNIDMFE